MNSQDPFDRILASLHAAALDHSLWPDAASRVNEFIGAKGSGLAYVGGHTPADMEIFWRMITFRGERREDWEQSYFHEHISRDERIPRLLALPHAHLAHTNDVYTDREKRHSPVYNGAMVEMRGQNGLQVRLDAPEEMHLV